MAKKIKNNITNIIYPEAVNLSPLGLGAWSHSKVKCLSKCPLQFYLKYVLKLGPTTAPPKSLATEVGKAAHRVLELVTNGKSIENSFKIVRKEFTPILSDEEWEDNVANLEYSVTSFRERLDNFERNYGVKRYIQEIRLGVNKEWEPTGFFAEDVYYRGVIDLIIQLESGDTIFIDHKTGLPAITGIKYNREQLNTYKVLFNFGIQKIDGAQAGIHFIRDGEVIMDEYVDNAEIEGSLRRRMEFAIEGAIDTVKEIGYFKHVAASSCQYCDFREECKGKQLVQIEKESKKWFEIKEVQ